MNALDRASTKLAVGLAILAGFVDALGFLELKGIFVSFMTGNSTRLAVSTVTGGIHGSVAVLGAVLGTFVSGMFLATLLVNDRQRQRTATLVLGLITLLLLAGFGLALLSLKVAAIAAMILAMGAANAAIQRDGEIVVGVTYMTGALVKFAQKLAQAFAGGPAFAWAPYFLLWLGLIAGGIAGALIYDKAQLHALVLAALWAAGLTLLSWRKAT